MLDAVGVRAAEGTLFENGLAVEALLETAMERVWAMLSGRFGARGARASRVSRWLVLAGPGHNGADGWALARKAAEAGLEVDVFEPLSQAGGSGGQATKETKHAKPLTLAQRRFALAQGVRAVDASFLSNLGAYDVRIDAVFGFGLARDLDASLVAFLRRLSEEESRGHTLRIAIDLPTGLCSDTGRARPFVLPAQETFVLGAMKPGLLSDSAPSVTGILRFVPLGHEDQEVRKEGKSRGDAVFLESPLHPAEVCGRGLTEHKLSQGELALVAGSVRYPGAGLLTLAAAQAAKPGYVRLASDSPETRAAALTLHPETIVSSVADALAPSAGTFARVKVGVVGCGMEPPHDEGRDAILDAFPESIHLVFDGAWCAPTNVDAARARGHVVVLTPHAGEFARAFPAEAQALKDGRIPKAEAARRAARAHGCYVVLKGPCTAIASPDGDVWQSTLANPNLARAGSGDALAGFLGGLLVSGLAKGIPVMPLLATGVWWHGSFGLSGAGAGAGRDAEDAERLATEERAGSEGLALARYLSRVCSARRPEVP